MKDFRNLDVWERAHSFVLKIYTITKSFPKDEVYGLTSQVRRASTSIPTNIVEGSSRGSEKDFSRFLQISIGSASEVEYLLMLSKDLKYINENTFAELQNEIIIIRKMLINLTKKLR